MNEKPHKPQRWGIIWLGMLVLAGLGFVMQRTYFAEGLQLRTQFANVGGLRIGAEVLMSGFSVGHVVAIQPSDASMRRFAVTIRFDRHYLIPDDSQVALYQSHPLDIVRLNIILGQASTLFNSGDLIQHAAVPPSLFDNAVQIGIKVTAVLDRLDTLAQHTTTTMVRVNQLLGAPDHRDADATLHAVLGQTQASLKQAQKLFQTLDGEIKRSNLARLSEDTHQTLQTSRMNLDQLQTIEKHVDAVLGQIATLVATNADAVYRMAHDGEFILRNLATNITTLIENIQILTINLSELAQKMRDHPDTLLFGRRHHDEPGTAHTKE